MVGKGDGKEVRSLEEVHKPEGDSRSVGGGCSSPLSPEDGNGLR